MELDQWLTTTHQEECVAFTYRLENAADQEVTLTFVDACRVEFIVEEDDEEIWRWSDGRIFALGPLEESLSPGEKIDFSAHWDLPPEGQYTVRAELRVEETELATEETITVDRDPPDIGYRRAIQTDEEALIDGQRLIATLATSNDDRPHATPIWYYYDAGSISMITTGKKVDIIKRNPRVAVSIQDDVEGYPEWMVLVKGTASVHDESETVTRESKKIYKKYYGEDISEWEPSRRQIMESPPEEVSILEIAIGSVSSKRY